MSYRIERNLSRVLAILAVAGFGAASVRAGDQPGKIQVSEPASSLDSTNLTRINPNALNSQAGEDDFPEALQELQRRQFVGRHF